MAVTLGSSGITYADSSAQTSAYTDRGMPISITQFTSGGTYTVPSNCTTILVQLVGGGGGSAGYNESGGAGGFAEGYFSVSPNATYAVTKRLRSAPTYATCAYDGGRRTRQA